MADDKPKGLQLFGAKTLRNGAPFIEVIRQDGSVAYGVIKVDCDSREELEEMATLLANRPRMLTFLHLAWCQCVDSAVGDHLAEAYFLATGRRADGKPVEGLDEWRRTLGLEAKTGHLSEIEIKMFCRNLDKSVGKDYNPDEPIESQAKRVAADIRIGCQHWDASSAKELTLEIAAELDRGYWVDRGEGTLGEIDEVLSRVPQSGSGRAALPPKT